MKRLLILPLFLFIFVSANSQVGVGIRGIWGIDGNAYGGGEFSIQKLNSWEVDFGTYAGSWKATGLKHFSLVERRNLGIYWGLGMGYGYNNYIDLTFGTFAANFGSYIKFGHLQMGLDWRPEWNFFNAPGRDLSFNLALSARWVFGR